MLSHWDMRVLSAVKVSWYASSSFCLASVIRRIHCCRMSNGLESTVSSPPANKARVVCLNIVVPFRNSSTIFPLTSAEIRLSLFLSRYPFRCSHRSQAICHSFRINALNQRRTDLLDRDLDSWTSWAERHSRAMKPSKKFPHPYLYCFVVASCIQGM